MISSFLYYFSTSKQALKNFISFGIGIDYKQDNKRSMKNEKQKLPCSVIYISSIGRALLDLLLEWHKVALVF